MLLQDEVDPGDSILALPALHACVMKHLIELVAMCRIEIIEFRSVLDVFDFQLSLALSGKKAFSLLSDGIDKVAEFLQVFDVEVRSQEFRQKIRTVGIRIGDEDDLILEILHRLRQKCAVFLRCLLAGEDVGSIDIACGDHLVHPIDLHIALSVTDNPGHSRPPL